jgi:acyl carrier protein
MDTHMETPELYEKFTSILHDVFDDDDLVARPDLTANDVDGWDSLAHIRLVLTVERTFGIKFSASEIAQVKNVGEFINLIHSKLS